VGGRLRADEGRSAHALKFDEAGQRAMIALALSCRPGAARRRANYALDVTVLIQIILLLRQLQPELGVAVIFVTHDVGVAIEVADRIAVMYAGRFVEVGPTEKVIDTPAHPYTAALLTSTVLGSTFGRRLEAIPGAPPDLRALPAGCSFAARCRHTQERCRVRMPPESALAPGRITRCVRVADGELDLGSPNLSERSLATT